MKYNPLTQGVRAGNEINALRVQTVALHPKMHQIPPQRVVGDLGQENHQRCTRSWYLHLWQTLDTDASDKQHRKIIGQSRLTTRTARQSHCIRDHLTSLRERVGLYAEFTRKEPAAP